MADIIPLFGSGFIRTKPPTLSLLDEAKTPAEWVEILFEKGITYSERSLREKANKLGACAKLGRTMLITPSHMETILKDSVKCRSNPTDATAKSGGSKAELTTTASPSPDIISAALELSQSNQNQPGHSYDP